MIKLYLNDMEMLCAAGNKREHILKQVQKGNRSGLLLSTEFSQNSVYLGKVQAELPGIEKNTVFTTAETIACFLRL